jgi:hypothetical protein
MVLPFTSYVEVSALKAINAAASWASVGTFGSAALGAEAAYDTYFFVMIRKPGPGSVIVCACGPVTIISAIFHTPTNSFSGATDLVSVVWGELQDMVIRRVKNNRQETNLTDVFIKPPLDSFNLEIISDRFRISSPYQVEM